MKLGASFAPRLAVVLCGLAGVLCWAVANAEAQGPAPASLSPAASVYQDRYIGGGSLSPDISMGDNSTSDTGGLARSVQIDAVASILSSHDAGPGHDVTENGLIARTQWETAAYGAWSLDA